MKGGLIKMNKKYIAFGIVSLFAVALVASALVDYISNEASVSVDVEHPVNMQVQKLDDGENWYEHRTLEGAYGCETTGLNYRIENLADVDIGTVPFGVLIENSEENVTCEDFTSVKLNGDEVSGECNEDHGQIYFTGTTTKDAHEIEYGNVTLTFACNVAPTTYDIKSRVFYTMPA